MCNAEKVQALRDKATLKKQEVSKNRKSAWDAKAKDSEFSAGDEVLVCKPGINMKLMESWEGPFKILKRNSHLSYKVDMGDRVIPSVHVQLMKKYFPGGDSPRVNRVTSVFEPDMPEDTILDRYSEVKVSGDQLDDKKTEAIRALELEFQDILTKEPGLTNLVRFSIDTAEQRPIHQRAYSTPAALKDSIDKEIDWLLSKQFIRPSDSPWASPMVTVRKPDGSARLCVDFKAIKQVTVQAPIYMRRVVEVLESVGKSQDISKIDLTKGYYQIPMVEENIGKTEFTCHRGRFEFLRMPFGVKNAPAVFQELIQSVFKNDRDHCSPYMHDIVIFSQTWEDHVRHIRSVLARLRAAGLTANPAKCKWGGRKMEFLGHLIGESKMSVPSHRAEALANYSRPITKKRLRAFLGAIGFYRHYVQLLAKHTAVLTPLTSKQAPSKVMWMEEGELAFNAICLCISQSCSLCIPLPQDVFSIITDASGLGVGGVL